jgi:3-hydroxybutyryl-CoA dehydrogenase
MGFNLFSYLSGFGFDLSLYQRSNPEKLLKKHQRKLARQLKNGIITETKYNQLLDNQQIGSALEIIAKADLLIECLAEDLQLKNQFLNEAEKIVSSDTIFASNSSSILPSELHISDDSLPRLVGMHFFYPIETKAYVELISSEHSSEITIKSAVSFLNKISKQALHQDPENAFLVNKVLLDLQSAAYNLSISKNLSIAFIDRAVTNSFMSLGIFEMMDHIGLDVLQNSINNYLRDHDEADKYAPLLDRLSEMNKKQCLGVKTGKGFYNYSDKIDSETSSDGSSISLQGIANYLEEILSLSIRRFTKQSENDRRMLEKAVFEILSF